MPILYLCPFSRATPNLRLMEKSMRILIVEDDFMSRKVLTKYLAPYGECEIDKVFTVSELELLHEPDLVAANG